MVAQRVMRLLAETAEASYEKWLDENAAAFDAQTALHSRYGHPLADIITGPAGSSWGAADQRDQIVPAIEALKENGSPSVLD